MATDDCPSALGRLVVIDRRSNTGSDLCVYPRSELRDRRSKADFQLSAANGFMIETYGFIELNLN